MERVSSNQYERWRSDYVYSFDSEQRALERQKIAHRRVVLESAEKQGIDLAKAEAQGLSPSQAGLLDLLPQHIATQGRTIPEIVELIEWPSQEPEEDIESWFKNFEVYDLVKRLSDGSWQLTGWGREVAPRIFEDSAHE